ncbi:MAG: menaquinone biosynthesis protein [Planctomycetia bacterium]|nr:menaquinone biosynthesis protein [Planctomycetia bacterium]
MVKSNERPIGPSLRIGAVTYLNARPLSVELARLAPEAEIVVDLPSRLADGLAQGRLDVAIIPSIEFLRQPGSRIVSDACVSCDGPVRSVMLYSRVPIARIGTLALDEGSRTSAVLARILLREQFHIEPRLRPLPIGASADQSDADAVVLIGDRGMLPAQGPFEVVWDLGEQWKRWTGLPFVFAMWVARPGIEMDGLEELFAAARDAGVLRFAEIARAASPEIGVPEAECLSYLRDNLVFHLGPRQRQGMRRFFELAEKVENPQSPASNPQSLIPNP